MAALLLLSVLILPGMFTLAESAPQEAVYVGLACYLGICARIAQAGRQSRGWRRHRSCRTRRDHLSTKPINARQ